MNAPQPEPDPEGEVPVWARADAFAAAPVGFGWQDGDKRQHPCASLAELTQAVGEDLRSRVELVWTPAYPNLVVPEEVPELLTALARVKRRWALDDRAEALRRMRWLGGLALAAALWAWWQGGLAAIRHSVALGMVLIAGLIFGFIPWYQASKRLRMLTGWSAELMAGRIPEMRFETWLGRQRAPLTHGLIVVLAMAGAAQLLVGSTDWRQAGLIRELYLGGERWRLLTGPWLHGHPIHWILNASALLYLGRRVEVMARWPHLLMVYLAAAVFGGLATVYRMSAVFPAARVPEKVASIGASGAIMGLLGFLLAFETLHGRLVPVRARRRLLAGLALTGFIGALAFAYIDNWAHAGGLLAGLIYGAIVFPRSASPHRPRSTKLDVLAGAACGAVLLASAGWTLWRLLPV